MLRLTLKQSIVVVMLITALLVTLVAGIIRADAVHYSLPGHSALHGTHSVAMYCPPPPVIC